MKNSVVEYITVELHLEPSVGNFLAINYFGEQTLQDLEGEQLVEILELVQDGKLTVTAQEWRYLSQFIDADEFLTQDGDE